MKGHELRLKLEQLAERSGVSSRTVRYYVQRGLLPAPEFRGRDTAYTGEHLVRLQAIRRLQERFLPLDAIQELLSKRTLDEVERIAAGEEVTGLPGGSAQEPDSDGVETEATEDEVKWARWQLAPGLELHLADDAAEAVKELAGRLRREASGQSTRRGRR